VPEDAEPAALLEPKPWWDALDAKVRDALVTAQELEGASPDRPDLYERSGRVVRRFAAENAELVAALSERYASLEDEDDKELTDADRQVVGIGLWITENVVGEPFVPRAG
jgi:hypothetical protein